MSWSRGLGFGREREVGAEDVEVVWCELGDSQDAEAREGAHELWIGGVGGVEIVEVGDREES